MCYIFLAWKARWCFYSEQDLSLVMGTMKPRGENEKSAYISSFCDHLLCTAPCIMRAVTGSKPLLFFFSRAKSAGTAQTAFTAVFSYHVFLVLQQMRITHKTGSFPSAGLAVGWATHHRDVLPKQMRFNNICLQRIPEHRLNCYMKHCIEQ